MGHSLLDGLLLRFDMAHLGDVVVEGLSSGSVGKLDSPDPLPVRMGPAASALSIFVKLVPDISPPDEQMGEAVLGAGEVVADVLERTREVAGALCLDVGHEHLHDVVRH